MQATKAILINGLYKLGIILLLASCNSSKLIPVNKRISLSEINLNSISGRYDNNSDDTTRMQRTTFWAHLKPFHNDTNLNKTAYDKIPNSSIKIDIIDKNKIRFSRYDSEFLKESKIFRFKVKDSVILIKKFCNKRSKGIPFIFYKQHRETLNLSLDNSSNLVLSYEGIASGMILIMYFGEPIKGTRTFIRK